MLVSAVVLLLCIVVGMHWYRVRHLGGQATFRQAVVVGLVVSVGTGIVYACYNLISIRFFYPNFLDQVVRARIAQLEARGNPAPPFEQLRAGISAMQLAIPNLLRLSVGGAILSLLTAPFGRGGERGGRR
jgi:hypothetical protein